VPGGKAIVLVPQGPWNHGTLDEVLGHRRRYTKQGLQSLAASCGFRVAELIEFNRIGTAAWFLNGKILRRRSFGLTQIFALNLLTPLFRIMDGALPLPSLSLIGILERSGDDEATVKPPARPSRISRAEAAVSGPG
jgi:hypothetical protein